MNLHLSRGLAEFNADPQRARSGECDYGAWWTPTANLTEFPRYSISWIMKTGELYIWNTRDDSYQVIAIVPTERAADVLMEGWADPDSPIYHNLIRLLERISQTRSVSHLGN